MIFGNGAMVKTSKDKFTPIKFEYLEIVKKEVRKKNERQKVLFKLR